MKSGYYIYNNEKYRFELDDEYITVVNENGVDWEKSGRGYSFLISSPVSLLFFL